MTPLLFVYGTLMSSFNNEPSKYLQSNSSFLGKATTKGSLFLVKWQFNYPAFTSIGNNVIYGEVYKINNTQIFDYLDQYEGDQYEKREIEVSINEKRHKAIAYVFTSSTNHLTEITSGDFLNL